MKLEKTYRNINSYGEKYHFYHNVDHRTIVCTTVYKGQTVRGIAKCNPEDKFDLNIGKKLAYLRCKHKLMRHKSKHAHKVYDVALNEVAKVNKVCTRRASLSKMSIANWDSLQMNLLISNASLAFNRR